MFTINLKYLLDMELKVPKMLALSQMLVASAQCSLSGKETELIACKMASRAAALLATLLLFCLDGCVSEYTSSGLSSHIDTLLAEYDREVPPLARTVVTLSLDVRHAAVNDASATMRLLADLKMSWVDTRLVWNATQWEGSSVLVSAERLWGPDVALAGGGVVRAEGGLRARVAADGAVSRVQRLDLAVPVAMQLTRWPKDTQQADFKFASRAHSIDELDLVISDYKGSVVVECGAWEVESVSGSAVSSVRADGGAVRAAAWAVRATRRGAALALQHGAVLAAATLLLAAALARPYPQRMPLAAAATLVAALWLIAVMFVVPAASSTPRIVSLMCALCAAGAACGAGAALAGRVARRLAPPPAALRALLSRLSHVHAIAPHPECLSETRSGAWAAAAQLLDALLAALVALTLLVLIAVHLLA